MKDYLLFLMQEWQFQKKLYENIYRNVRVSKLILLVTYLRKVWIRQNKFHQ